MAGSHRAAAAIVLAVCLAAVVPAQAVCPSDCESSPDGSVGVTDLLALLAQWGAAGPCDLDDGLVGTFDLLALLAVWGPCPPAVGACCDPSDAGCSQAQEAACLTGGGAYGGNDTDCTDSDTDRIPDAFELGDCSPPDGCFSGTSPSMADTDGDGIWDGDEIYGTPAGLDLPSMGLDPCRKDILVETDWVHTAAQPPDRNKLHVNQVSRIIAAFAAAATTNPDGSTGITLHIDGGQAPYGGGNSVLDPSGNTRVDVDTFGFNSGEYFTIKAANFGVDRHGYFHYAVLCDSYSVAGTYQNSSGLGELPGDDLIVSMGQWAVGDDDFIGNTVMHELGHNLSLRHGGDENVNFKPNYNSVMNYWYQFCGADGDDDVIPDGILDYSRNLHIALSENNLVEPDGVTGAGPGIDWSGDGDSFDTMTLNINCRLTNTYANSACINHVQQPESCGVTGNCYDNNCTALTDHDDWGAVQLFHLGDADFAPGEVVHCLLDGPVVIPAD